MIRIKWSLAASPILIAVFFLVFFACNKEGKRRTPRSVYMGDMYDSRAFQAQNDDVFFNAKVGSRRPDNVLARGEVVAYTLPNTEEGYLLSAGVQNPLEVNEIDMQKAERLYVTFCGICHGNNLDGNGYLYRDGEGPFIAKPATLVGDAQYENMKQGTMFHSALYGKNLMGSYASQLTQKEIWMVVAYIKAKQGKAN